MVRSGVWALSVYLLAVSSAPGETIPAALAPPGGSQLASSHPAKGVQIYACSVKGGAETWVLKAPDADLSNPDGKTFAHHFAGPTWQAPDGSKVVGVLVAKAPAPDKTSIPWLLLSAKSSGQGALAGVTYVQRLDTKGGAAPASPCTAGQELRVPYTATYSFFR